MLHVFRFWYIDSLERFYHSLQNSLRSFEGQIAVRDTLKNLAKPIFQDYTFQGRLIGMLLRLARIFAGLFVYFLTILVYLFGYLLWLLLPLLFSIMIVGSLIGTV